MLDHARWTTHRTHIDRGETLVLYSDGLVEALVDGEELGVSGLRTRIRAENPRAILSELAEVSDDLTLVTIRR
jgi:serine phosphatase RsbU (regulator of sigma subunit)